jgi:hypothetical protein
MITNFIKTLIPGTRTGAKSKESPTPSEESPKSGSPKEVTLVLHVDTHSEAVTITNCFYSLEKAKEKINKKENVKGWNYATFSILVEDAE